MIKRDANGRVLKGSESPNKAVEPRSNWPIRYWAKVDKNGPIPPHRPELGPCWEWKGYIGWNGYGSFLLIKKGEARKIIVAHCIAFFLGTGQWPDPELDICHKCDNRSCQNPDHLFEGTRKDNMMDASAKGRLNVPHPSCAGEKHHNAKATWAIVHQIRGEPVGTLDSFMAKKYGLSPGTIYQIRHYQTWNPKTASAHTS